MKRMTATDARKNWFRVLDEVVNGEVVLIEREGARVMLKLVEAKETLATIPDYTGLISITEDLDRADQWGWAWDGSPEGLHPEIQATAILP